MELMSLDCPRCGAQLPPRDPVGQIECEYCNASFQAPQARAARNARGQAVDTRQLAQMIAQEMAAQQQRAAPAPMAPSPYAGQRVHHVHARRSGAGCFITVLVLLIAGVGIAVALVTSGRFSGFGLSDFAAAVNPERMLYGGQPPALAEINGKPAFIARTRIVTPDDKLFVDAYDAQTVERVWRVGPLGGFSAAHQAVHFAVMGDRVIISHADSFVSVHNVDTGEQLSSHTLTDTVKEICAPPPGKKIKTVWLRKIDKQNLMLDPKAGKLEEADRPEWCRESWSYHDDDNRPDFAPEELAPEVEGFKTEHVHRVGKSAVVAGVKDPGTALPIVVGFDPKTKEANWQTDVYAVDRTAVRPSSTEHGALAGGRFFTVYGSGTDFWHVTAFNAKSGEREWHTNLRPIFAVDSINGIRASKTHVFVMRTSSLEVFDAKTGDLLGTVGTETYD